MQKFVTTITSGVTPIGNDEIVLSLYGPRGGQRAIESLTPAAARSLGHELIAAAYDLELEMEREKS